MADYKDMDSNPNQLAKQDGHAFTFQSSYYDHGRPPSSDHGITINQLTASQSWNNGDTSNPTPTPDGSSNMAARVSTSLYSLFQFPSLRASLRGSSRARHVYPEDLEIRMEAGSMRMNSRRRSSERPATDLTNPSQRTADLEAAATNVEGVRLTWEDLCVTVPAGGDAGGWRAILEGCTGYALPGRILGLMGPSGCGKSTLLDTLAGRMSSKARLDGQILVNGRTQPLAFGSSAYVTQEDILLTTLTVREAVYYAAQLQLPGSMTKHEILQRADDTIRDMGLKEAAETRIGGGPQARGLSGGQRRRVTICLEILTRPSLLFLDEPTSGLDSAASFHVMQRIVALARRHGQTVVVSVHQPSSEVFELLDDLYLLSQGKTVYFGHANQASEFFAENGFPCPLLMNPPDHYLKTINKNFELEPDERPSDGEAPKISISESINILVNSYKASSYKTNVAKRVAEISAVEGRKLLRRSRASFITQSLVLTQRSMVNMFRDAGYYWLRLVIYLGIAFALGTIYFKLDHSYESIAERMSVLVFVSGFITFMTIGGFPSFVEDLKVFEGERLNGHYGVVAYVISHTLSSLPFLFLVSLIPGVITYYMVGFQKSFTHFSYFCLHLYMLLLLVESLMMVVAGIVSNYLLGIISGAGVQGIMLLVGGFYQKPGKIPDPFWKYPLHYVAFHKYGDQGFSKNEFYGLTFDNKDGGRSPGITGMEAVKDMYQMDVGYSKWVDLAVLVGMAFVYRAMFLMVLKFKEQVLPAFRGCSSCGETC